MTAFGFARGLTFGCLLLAGGVAAEEQATFCFEGDLSVAGDCVGRGFAAMDVDLAPPQPINMPGGDAQGQAGAGAEPEAVMVAFVQAVSRTTLGTHLFLLSNGQQWEQVQHGNVSLQQGDQVRITRMRGNHYEMQAADGSRRPIAVRPH